MEEVVSIWYANFIDLEKDVLFELVMAANFLDIKELLQLGSAKIAQMIKGKSIKEMR